MTNGSIDGVKMSTFETFDIPIFDEYDRDNLHNLDKEGQLPPEVEIGLERGTNSLWDYPPFNEVSDLMSIPIVDDHNFQSERFNTRELRKGILFVRKEALIYACQKYSIKNRVEYSTTRSDKCRLRLECRKGSKSCQWEVKASKKKKAGMWEITEYVGEHTCEVDIIPQNNLHFNKHFIGMEIKDLIRERLRYSPHQIIRLMRTRHNYSIIYMKAWKARQIGLKYLFGDWEESFARLPAYITMLVQCNPGTFVQWSKSPIEGGKESVDRIFWAFAPVIEAFKHCRPMISIDATHMYGKYKGVLMIALTLDANNQILPLCYALVEGENIDSWKWFMTCIRAGVTQREGLGVISDRHIGIMRTMEDDDWMPPKAHHRICIRHFASNFKQKVKCGAQRDLLVKMAYENQKKKFLQLFSDLRELLKNNTDALRWLDRVTTKRWTMSYDDEGRRWGSMTTNASECFNNVIKGGRDLPITALVHFTFKQVNAYFTERRDKYLDHNRYYTPCIEKKLAINRHKAGAHEVNLYDRDQGVATVITGFSGHAHTVRIHEKTCTCGKWQIFHYPCSHVLAVCAKEGISTRSCVASEYTMQAYIKTWAPTFEPLPDMAYWKKYDGPLHVPNKHFKSTKKGRKSSKRRHNEMDERQDRNISISESTSQDVVTDAYKSKRIFSSSICKLPGHTKRTCSVQRKV